MCDVLFNVDTLFWIYVHILTKTSYSTSLRKFCAIIGLPQIIVVIDSMHIPLSEKPNKWVKSYIAKFIKWNISIW
jgi:hypothetical protein